MFGENIPSLEPRLNFSDKTLEIIFLKDSNKMF